MHIQQPMLEFNGNITNLNKNKLGSTADKSKGSCFQQLMLSTQGAA
jgi:hypothetical protein